MCLLFILFTLAMLGPGLMSALRSVCCVLSRDLIDGCLRRALKLRGWKQSIQIRLEENLQVELQPPGKATNRRQTRRSATDEMLLDIQGRGEHGAVMETSKYAFNSFALMATSCGCQTMIKGRAVASDQRGSKFMCRAVVLVTLINVIYHCFPFNV